MEYVTKRILIQNVAKCWKAQYPNSKQDIHAALLALDLNTATEDDVFKVIGNDSWTKIDCFHCKAFIDEAVFLKTTYEYGPTSFCKDCIQKALKLFPE